MSPSAIQTQLGAARTRLILEHPFIGALVIHLPLVGADARWCATVATDARAIYYNPAYVAGLSMVETQFVLAHEALHCALGHFARRSHRVRWRWDVACDYAVNWLLADEGLKPAPGALIQPRFRGLVAEEIYPLIEPGTDAAILDRHLYDEYRPAGQAQPEPGDANLRGNEPAGAPRAGGVRAMDGFDEERQRPGNAEERTGLARRWQGRMVSAAQHARRAGRLSSSWRRLVDELVEPRLPWRHLMARFVMNAARADYTFQRPPRREGDALLPRLASGEVNLHVGLDTSASIQDRELAEFAAELDALKGQMLARITVHACDQQIDARGPWVFQPWDPVVLPRRLGGGGGTRFQPVFDAIAAVDPDPGVLVYFTDAEGEFPPQAPGYPVLWLVKGPGSVPWGERVQIN